jgi:predicted TIM-barrel fold metal-dependent hydrolase
MLSDEPFVDAHHHFWNLRVNPHPWLQDEPVANFRYGDYGALRRDYLPADFAQDTAGAAPAATVHIEAEWERTSPVEETRWLSALSAECGLPTACVAHVRLDAPDAAEVLAAQAAFPLVRGIRHKPAAAARWQDFRRGATGSMDDPDWRNGYAQLEGHGLSFDLQAPWWHLEQAFDLATDFPQTTLILNHTGLPSDRSAEGLRAWRHALEKLAHAPNTALKISGLGQRGVRWTAGDNVPLMQEAIAVFGVDRCMFASNFPVDSLVGGYATILDGFRAAISHRPPTERRALLHENAVRIYRLPNCNSAVEST